LEIASFYTCNVSRALFHICCCALNLSRKSCQVNFHYFLCHIDCLFEYFGILNSSFLFENLIQFSELLKVLSQHSYVYGVFFLEFRWTQGTVLLERSFLRTTLVKQLLALYRSNQYLFSSFLYFTACIRTGIYHCVCVCTTGCSKQCLSKIFLSVFSAFAWNFTSKFINLFSHPRRT